MVALDFKSPEIDEKSQKSSWLCLNSGVTWAQVFGKRAKVVNRVHFAFNGELVRGERCFDFLGSGLL